MASPQFDALIAEVTRRTTIGNSAKALIEQLFALRENPAAMVAVVTELKNANDVVEAAIVANTPAAEPPPA